MTDCIRITRLRFELCDSYKKNGVTTTTTTCLFVCLFVCLFTKAILCDIHDSLLTTVGIHTRVWKLIIIRPYQLLILHHPYAIAVISGISSKSCMYGKIEEMFVNFSEVYSNLPKYMHTINVSKFWLDYFQVILRNHDKAHLDCMRIQPLSSSIRLHSIAVRLPSDVAAGIPSLSDPLHLWSEVRYDHPYDTTYHSYHSSCDNAMILQSYLLFWSTNDLLNLRTIHCECRICNGAFRSFSSERMWILAGDNVSDVLFLDLDVHAYSFLNKNNFIRTSSLQIPKK